MKSLQVGTKVKLNRTMMNEDAGSIGYVYETYRDFDGNSRNGVSIIFQNGSYDGFSAEEQDLFLEVLGFESKYSNYEFKNVNTVQRDYKSGYWNFNG